MYKLYLYVFNFRVLFIKRFPTLSSYESLQRRIIIPTNKHRVARFNKIYINNESADPHGRTRGLPS